MTFKGFLKAWLVYWYEPESQNETLGLHCQLCYCLPLAWWILRASVSFLCETCLCFCKCLLWKGVGRNHTVLFVLFVYNITQWLHGTGLVASSQTEVCKGCERIHWVGTGYRILLALFGNPSWNHLQPNHTLKASSVPKGVLFIQVCC